MYPDSSLDLNKETASAVYFFTTAYDALNNWSAHQIKLWDQTFATVEHGFHYRKFDEINPEIARQILTASSPYAALQTAREYKEKIRPDWLEIRVGIMTELTKAKVAQHADVAEALRKTGSKQIYENSPWDKFWGYADGKGQNTMGTILMEVRRELLERAAA